MRFQEILKANPLLATFGKGLKESKKFRTNFKENEG